MRTLRHIFLLGLIFSKIAVAAELNIEITQGVDNPIPIAVVPFSWEGTSPLAEDIGAVVSADLQQVGEFRALPPSNMLSMPDEAAEVFFRDWRILAQDYLLVGKITHSPGSQLVQVQYEFFDVAREQKLIGEVLTGSVSQLRDIAHEISNVVFQQVTGTRGAFSTEILYVSAQFVSPELTYYRIEKSDYDGHRSQILGVARAPNVASLVARW